MTEHKRQMLSRLCSILKGLGLSRDQCIGVMSMMATEQMVLEIVEALEEKGFKTTPQETMNICSAVIKNHLDELD